MQYNQVIFTPYHMAKGNWKYLSSGIFPISLNASEYINHEPSFEANNYFMNHKKRGNIELI